MAWVLDGKTAGGVIANGDYEELAAEEREQLIILAETQAVPRHIVLASAKTDEVLQQRISELLLELHQTPAGQEIMTTFEKTSRFDSLPGGAEATFTSLQELFSPVR